VSRGRSPLSISSSGCRFFRQASEHHLLCLRASDVLHQCRLRVLSARRRSKSLPNRCPSSHSVLTASGKCACKEPGDEAVHSLAQPQTDTTLNEVISQGDTHTSTPLRWTPTQPNPPHWLHALRPMADRVLVDHAPAPTLLSEEPRCHSANDPVLVGAVIDPVRVHGFDGSAGRNTARDASDTDIRTPRPRHQARSQVRYKRSATFYGKL
jgi:hypothetical protein